MVKIATLSTYMENKKYHTDILTELDLTKNVIQSTHNNNIINNLYISQNNI